MDGHLNGFLYAPTILKTSIDPKKFIGNVWLFKHIFDETTKVNIYAFIPSTPNLSRGKSKLSTYNIGIYNTAGNVINHSVSIDQSSVSNKWKLLLEDYEMQEGDYVTIEMDNKTGETNKNVIFDAIKIEFKP